MSRLIPWWGLLLLGAAATLQAQYAVGGGVLANINAHTANFRTISPDIPNCCPGFESATGFGWGIFATYDGVRLAPQLRLLAELSYRRHEATFLQREPTTVSSPQGSATPGTFEHELRTRWSTVMTALLVGYSPVEELPQFQLRLGIAAGHTLSADFQQRERLVEPEYGYFADTGTRTRNEYAGRIPGTAPAYLLLGLGARYLLPLLPRNQLALQPSISAWLGLTRLLSHIPWRAHEVVFSLGVVYAPFELPSPLQPGTPQ